MGEMVIPQEEVRKMQLKGLEMALFFDSFCEKQGLLYYMCGGCCIGSIRNQGFIPWDDDVDVFMPREDYEKLKKTWVDTPEYSIQFPSEHFCTENQFATICANQTTFIKTYQKNLDINHGIVLDVIPIDGCPTGFARKMQKIWALLYSLFVVGKAPENHGKAVYTAGKILLALVPRSCRYRVWHYCEKKMTQYPIRDCQYITELCTGPGYMKNEYPKEIFEKAVRVPFEGHMMPIPQGYDQYLRIAFGDYMRLPPKEKQVNHHEYEIIDTEHSYRKYRGIYYMTDTKEQSK